jgi:hypothetical protein
MRRHLRALRLAPLALLALLALGCGASQPAPEPPPATTGQSFPQAMNLLCNVDKLANLTTEEDPFAIGQQRSAWLAERIENPDGIEFRTIVSVKGPDEQAKAIRKKAKEVGVDPCPLADAIEASPTGGLAP